MIPPLENEIRSKVDFYKKLLRLTNYEFTLKFDGYEDLEGNYAEISSDYDRNTALIRFNIEKLPKDPESEVDKTIIHELSHLLFWGLKHHFRLIIDKYVGDEKARNCFLDEFDGMEHKIVFTLEDALYNVKNKLQKAMDHTSSHKSGTIKKGIRKNQNKKRIATNNRRRRV
jgi:hypothetical protein